jgi:hypothetical protein
VHSSSWAGHSVAVVNLTEFIRCDVSDSFRLVQVRYQAIRRTAYDAALIRLSEAVPPGALLRLTPISRKAVAAWREQWNDRVHPSGVAWDWSLIADQCRYNPKLFHIAIWSGDTLCGLAVGHLSPESARGVRHTISLERVAGAPVGEHPLKGMVLSIAFTTAIEFGKFFGATRLRLMHPVSGMIARYEALGFTVVRKHNQVLYCEKEIRT